MVPSFPYGAVNRLLLKIKKSACEFVHLVLITLWSYRRILFLDCRISVLVIVLAQSFLLVNSTHKVKSALALHYLNVARPLSLEHEKLDV